MEISKNDTISPSLGGKTHLFIQQDACILVRRGKSDTQEAEPSQ
jgi:hypothetical protein